MRTYCKAYPLADLRRYDGWTAGAQPAEGASADDDFAYLCDDFTVLTDPIREEGVLFADVTPEWREFCTETLGFRIPDDLAFAQAEAEQA